MRYLRVQDFILLHDLVVEATGGNHGLRSYEALEAAAQRPKSFFAGKELYSNIFLKTASMMHSLIKNHPFVDGNKRTAILAAMAMLELNGLKFEASQAETIAFTLRVAKKKVPLEKIANWLKKHTKN